MKSLQFVGLLMTPEQYLFKMMGTEIVGNFMFIGFLTPQRPNAYKKYLSNTF